jgi:hypothetical protein
MIGDNLPMLPTGWAWRMVRGEPRNDGRYYARDRGGNWVVAVVVAF